MSDALYPAFDANGKSLYFTASTDMGLTTGWLDMSSQAHPVTRSVYVAVLTKDAPSPLPPESDEEKDEPAKDSAKDKDPLQKTDGATKAADAEKPADSSSRPDAKPAEADAKEE